MPAPIRNRPLTGARAWRAILRKDRSFDGSFVYAAVTTGIYCRPSCPARNPHRRNTLIFPGTSDAERHGYTPCSRCHPASLTPAENGVRAVIEHIHAHSELPITLRALARLAGLSPHHLQQTFKKIVGLSPREFCDARRLSQFKMQLRSGCSISDACYEAGYGSSRAIYERASRAIGMTPGAYRRGGRGIAIHFSIVWTSFGAILIAGAGRAVYAVLLGDSPRILLRRLREEFPHARLARRRTAVRAAAFYSCRGEDPLLRTLPLSLRREILEARFRRALTVRALTI